MPAGDGEESVGERINDDGFEDGWEGYRKEEGEKTEGLGGG